MREKDKWSVESNYHRLSFCFATCKKKMFNEVRLSLCLKEFRSNRKVRTDWNQIPCIADMGFIHSLQMKSELFDVVQSKYLTVPPPPPIEHILPYMAYPTSSWPCIILYQAANVVSNIFSLIRCSRMSTSNCDPSTYSVWLYAYVKYEYHINVILITSWVDQKNLS